MLYPLQAVAAGAACHVAWSQQAPDKATKLSFWEIASSVKGEPPLSFTIPKLNSSPLKSYQAPTGKDHLPTTIFQGRTVKLPRGQSCLIELLGVALMAVGYITLVLHIEIRYQTIGGGYFTCSQVSCFTYHNSF